MPADIVQFPFGATNTNPVAWSAIPNSSDFVLYINTDLVNTITLGFRSTIKANDLNSIPLPPLGTITLGANRTVYAIAPAGTANLIVVPTGGYWTPSAVQIAEQIFLKGVSVTFNGLGAIPPSGDITGAADSNAIQAQLNAVGEVTLAGNGTYYFKNTLLLGLNQYLTWIGPTIIKYVGATAAPAIQITNSTGTYQGNQHSGLDGLSRLQIDGSLAPTGSIGLQVGDIAQITLGEHIEIINYTGASAVGLYVLNAHFFTEQLKGKLFIGNCTKAVVFDVSGTGTNSFIRMNLEVWVNLFDTQDAVQLLGGTVGCSLSGRFALRGNFGSGPMGTGHVVNFQGAASNYLDANFDIDVECGGSGVGPQTMFFAGSDRTIQRCYGAWKFTAAPVAFQASNNSFNVNFDGPITGDNTLFAKANNAGWQQITTGFPTGWTGAISFKKIAEAGLVFIKFALNIANGTVVTVNELIATLPANYFLTGDNTIIVLEVNNAAVIQPVNISTTGAITILQTGFTVSGTAFLYGQAVYATSI